MEYKINLDLFNKKQSIRSKSEEKKFNNISRNFSILNNKIKIYKKFQSSLRAIKAKLLLKNKSTFDTNNDKLYLSFFKSNSINNYENISSAIKTEKFLPIKKYNHIVNGFRLSFRKKLLTPIKMEDKESIFKSEKKINPFTPTFRVKKFKKLKLFDDIKEEDEDIKEDEKEINIKNKSEIKLKRNEINEIYKNDKKKEKKYCLTNIIMEDEKDEDDIKNTLKEHKKINLKKIINNKGKNKEENEKELMKFMEIIKSKKVKINFDKIINAIKSERQRIIDNQKEEDGNKVNIYEIINLYNKEKNTSKKEEDLKKNKLITSYEGIPFKQELKTYSPICERCFRLVYISFDFISDYISSYCSYCKNLLVYKYDEFIDKISENKNPLLNCYCNKCFKSFIFSDSSNLFYLIEKVDYNFLIVCQECLKKDNNNEYVKKCECQELISHGLYLYENKYNNISKLDNLKNLEEQSEKINEKIKSYLNIYEEYKKNISKIESIIAKAPLSLRNQAQDKLLQLKKEIIIKNKIIEYYNQYRNFIIINNITSVLHTILDFSNFDLNNYTEKSKINDICHLIQKFINYKKFIKFISFEDLDNPIKFGDYSLITKNYLNKEQYIKDKNEPKELILNQSFLDIININFITGKT